MEEWLDLPEVVDKTQELIELGLYDEALELLNQYAEMFSDEWEIPFLYSRIYSEKDQPEKAIPYLHKGLHIDKTNADCLLGLFYAYSMMNQIKKGGRYLLRAEKYHPENDMVIASLIWFYTEINNYSEAIAYFEKSKRLGELNPEALRNGGLAFERTGDHENAEKCFLAALEINPQYDEVRDLLADHYIFVDLPQKAIDLYKAALKDSPRNIRIMSRLVFCYSQANQLEQAAFVAKEIIQHYPNSPVGYVDQAYVHLNHDDYAKAIECAEQANDVAPIDPEAFRVKGIAYSDKGENDKAEEAFLKAIDLDNDNVEIMRDYYHHLRKTGKNEEMEKWVNSVIELEDPYCVEDYWFLADYYREKGLNSKAFNYLHKAYKAMPNEKDLIPPMVDILLERDHTAFALSFLRNYVEKKGWNEVMDEFARHSKLRNRWLQEGIRFLRFWSDRPADYQKFIFMFFIKKFAILSSGIILVLSLLPIYLFFGLIGLIIGSSTYALSLAVYFIIKLIMNKRQSDKETTNESGI
jgi:tetratricopeptide (TPR) repeat protein